MEICSMTPLMEWCIEVGVSTTGGRRARRLRDQLQWVAVAVTWALRVRVSSASNYWYQGLHGAGKVQQRMRTLFAAVAVCKTRGRISREGTH
jgi:hypothetical protein